MPRIFKPIRVCNDVAFVTLTQGKEAIIDVVDLHIVEGFNWYAQNIGRSQYACRNCYITGMKRLIYMHREIINPEEKLLVDHIDGNGLNNKRSNLRSCTHGQNACNKEKPANNTTGYKGVCYSKKQRAYMASIRSDGKQMHLGFYETPEEAYDAYCRASAKYHGEFGRRQ